MASLKVAKNRNSLSRVRDGLASPVKKLTFEDMSDDDLEFHPPASDVGIRKRIDFGPSDDSDMDPNAEDAVPIPPEDAAANTGDEQVVSTDVAAAASPPSFPTPPKEMETPSGTESVSTKSEASNPERSCSSSSATTTAAAAMSGCSDNQQQQKTTVTKMNLRQRPLAKAKKTEVKTTCQTPKAKSRRTNLRKRALLKEATSSPAAAAAAAASANVH